MKVYQAAISTATDYENDLSDEHHEYGCDKAVLLERLKAAALKLAPLEDWKLEDPSMHEFNATITIGSYYYCAYLFELELVC